MLGEKITATIKAKYYFGSPVAKAKVKYKVYRTAYDQQWYPRGLGIGSTAQVIGGSPTITIGILAGTIGAACGRCRFGGRADNQPPELVADQEVDIGPDGTVKVEIDTGLAKAIHPDEDQKYSITAEVVDESRRTIVGTGDVLVARKPFSVYAWVDRGYYRVGDTIKAEFAARTLDGKPIEGKGDAYAPENQLRQGQ